MATEKSEKLIGIISKISALQYQKIGETYRTSITGLLEDIAGPTLQKPVKTIQETMNHPYRMRKGYNVSTSGRAITSIYNYTEEGVDHILEFLSEQIQYLVKDIEKPYNEVLGETKKQFTKTTFGEEKYEEYNKEVNQSLRNNDHLQPKDGKWMGTLKSKYEGILRELLQLKKS